MNECTYKNYDELPLMLTSCRWRRCWASPAPERMNWFTVRASLR